MKTGKDPLTSRTPISHLEIVSLVRLALSNLTQDDDEASTNLDGKMMEKFKISMDEDDRESEGEMKFEQRLLMVNRESEAQTTTSFGELVFFGFKDSVNQMRNPLCFCKESCLVRKKGE